MSNLDLWELAKRKVAEGPKKIGMEDNDAAAENKENDEWGSEETHLLMMGSKECGKTTLLLRFLEREEAPKPTIALEYTFARRTRQDRKEVGHLWELGGGPFLTNLLDVPVSLPYLTDLSLLLVLDLSKPEELWHCAETLLVASKARLAKLMGELKLSNPKGFESVLRAGKARVPPDHQDKDLLRPFPVPLAIVGAKYDLYQDMESEKRKMMAKTLRFLAHTNGASLVFYSGKMEGLVTRGRALLSQLVFHTQGSRGLSVDHNKPLFVPAGADSFADIGAPPGGASGASNPLELWKSAFTSQFPQTNTTMEVRDDPAKDVTYKEEAIDSLRALKDAELERLMVTRAREAEQEAKLAVPIPRPSTTLTRKAPPKPADSSPEPSPRDPTPRQPPPKAVAPLPTKTSSPKPPTPNSARSIASAKLASPKPRTPDTGRGTPTNTPAARVSPKPPTPPSKPQTPASARSVGQPQPQFFLPPASAESAGRRPGSGRSEGRAEVGGISPDERGGGLSPEGRESLGTPPSARRHSGLLGQPPLDAPDSPKSSARTRTSPRVSAIPSSAIKAQGPDDEESCKQKSGAVWSVCGEERAETRAFQAGFADPGEDEEDFIDYESEN